MWVSVLSRSLLPSTAGSTLGLGRLGPLPHSARLPASWVVALSQLETGRTVNALLGTISAAKLIGVSEGSTRSGIAGRTGSLSRATAGRVGRAPNRGLANVELAGQRCCRLPHSIALRDHQSLLRVQLGRPSECHAAFLSPLNACLRPGH